MRRRRVIMLTFRPSVIRRALVLLAALLFLAIFREAAIRTTAPLSEMISGRTVVIDPGHGGPDPGCVTGQTVEKEIVLAIAKKLATRFDRAFMRATLTREGDTDLADPEVTGARARKRQDIARRAEVANGGADLLISVHANSFPSPVWSGAQTFYYPQREESRKFAVQMQNALVNRLGPNVRREKGGDYLLLDRAKVPAVLVEVGFLSNPREAELLSDPSYQEKVAGALFAGAVQYLAQRHTGRIPAEITLNHRRSSTTAQEWSQRWRAVKDRSREEAVLYFLGPTNRDDYLVPELRRVAGFGDMGEAERVRAALAELISGPGDKSALLTSVPRSLSVAGVSVAGRSVRVCLETGLEGFGLGERGEELALYAIVNTVSEIVPGAVVSVVAPNGEPAQSGVLGAVEGFTARPDLLCPGRE